MKTKLEAVGNHPTLGPLVARYASGQITYPRGYNPAPAITCAGLFYIVFSIGGKLIAGVGEDQYVHLWDVETGRELWKAYAQNLTSEFHELMFGPEDELVAVVNNGFAVVEKFNIANGEVM